MKECWNCGRNLMEEAPELGVGWLRCECGATEGDKLPKVTQGSQITGVYRQQKLKEKEAKTGASGSAK